MLNSDFNEAIKNKNTNELFNKLSDADKSALTNILSDKSKLNEVLSSDKAQQIMKMLGLDKNG